MLTEPLTISYPVYLVQKLTTHFCINIESRAIAQNMNLDNFWHCLLRSSTWISLRDPVKRIMYN